MRRLLRILSLLRKVIVADAESFLFFGVGVLVFVAGRFFAEGLVARSALQVLGAGACLVSPVLGRLEGMMKITRQGVEIPLGNRSLRRRALVSTAIADDENLPAVIEVANASHEALAGILNFLRNDVSSAQLTVPGEFDGKSLVDPALQFIRKELRVSVVAIRQPSDRWTFGGEVSEAKWVTGMEVLVCGPPSGIEQLVTRFSTPHPQ